MKTYKTYFLFSLLILATGCDTAPKKTVTVSAEKMHELMDKLTDVIVHDIFSPPVAARIYAYPSIAAYEVLAADDSVYLSLAGQLKALKKLPTPEGREINREVAAIESMYLTAKTLVFSEDKMEAWHAEWLQYLDQQAIDQSSYDNSRAYADTVSKFIMAWANADNYNQTRTMSKHFLGTKANQWEPTPPAYMDAIEPHWNKMRTFVIDSANQFIPEKPTSFSTDSTSTFYKETMEVYETVNNATEEQKEIASFWDCNPYVMNVTGHVMFATKKITPGGHWMSIAKIAASTANASLMKSAQAYALTSIALHDAFVACWDEKFRSNLIRPETVINRYIDEEWKPLLQTPPFPEHTSGHSVISTASAIALTTIFDDNFQFTDSTEVKYGLPARKYSSFKEASQEAAISRLYGGIHYMPAITEGVKQGEQVGQYVISQLKFKQNQSLTRQAYAE